MVKTPSTWVSKFEHFKVLAVQGSGPGPRGCCGTWSWDLVLVGKGSWVLGWSCGGPLASHRLAPVGRRGSQCLWWSVEVGVGCWSVSVWWPWWSRSRSCLVQVVLVWWCGVVGWGGGGGGGRGGGGGLLVVSRWSWLVLVLGSPRARGTGCWSWSLVLLWWSQLSRSDSHSQWNHSRSPNTRQAIFGPRTKAARTPDPLYPRGSSSPHVHQGPRPLSIETHL